MLRHLLGQKPQSKPRPHHGEIGARNNCAHKPNRPVFCFVVGHAFENAILKTREDLRNAEPRFILRMMPALDSAADSAALAVLPVNTFDNFVGRAMRFEL